MSFFAHRPVAPVLLMMFAFGLAPLSGETPAVSGVTASQADGTKEVAITYDLSISGGGTDATADIAVRASRDGGNTFETVPESGLSGAVGPGQSPGTGKRITWEAGAMGWEARVYDSAQVEVVATTSGGDVTPVEMVRVAGGTLPAVSTLGALDVDTFYIGKYEVTWGEWKAVRAQAAAYDYDDIDGVGEGCADDHPVHYVSWYDALKWCNAKSEMEGLTPVYRYNGSTYRSGYPTHTDISQNLSANGYRLPQEAEWEFAARGGNATNGFTFSGGDDLNAVGWYGDNSGGSACDFSRGRGTWPVGQKEANELGLYDMSGNVSEPCWDRNNDARRFRGGSWSDVGGRSAVSNRINRGPGWESSISGFRLARSSGN